jgi:hypothetical protein
MNRILALSVAIVASGFLSSGSRPAPRFRFAPPSRMSASRVVALETRSFAYRSEKDSVGGGETITRDGDVISGDMFIGAKHAHYEGRIAADGTIPRLEIRAWRSAAEAKHPRLASAVLGRDSATVIEHLGARVDTLRFASQPGLLPVINPSIGLLELVVARARSQNARSAKVPILLIDALGLDSPGKNKVEAATAAVDVTFLAADTVRLGNGISTDQMRFIIGADGRCRGAKNGATAKDHFSMVPTSKPVTPRFNDASATRSPSPRHTVRASAR